MKIGPSGVKPHAAVVSEAAAWFIEFRAGDIEGDARERFVAWLRRSPEHIQAYLEVASSWAELPTDDPDHKIDVSAMIARARDEADVVMLSPRAGTQSMPAGPQAVRATSQGTRAASKIVAGAVRRGGLRQWARRSSVLVAAPALLVWIALGVLWLSTRGETYTTGIGEQHTVRLADGSLVELNARSEVRVRITKYQRLAELHEGQALFHVAKDAARPFIVDAGNAQVRAVGTEFDVYRKRSGTVVTVVEGRVAVGRVTVDNGAPTTPAHSDAVPASSIFLSAGEQLTVARNAAATPRPVDTQAVTAWVQKRLVFEETPLSDVADEFNRYNTRTLIIDDPALRQVKISGIYSSTDPASLIGFLRAQPTIQVIETPQGIQIRKR